MSYDDDYDDGYEDDEEYDVDEEFDDDVTVPCPYCRREIHEDAVQCPYCEQYISEEDAPREAKPWWLVLGVAVCLVILLAWVLL